MELKQKVVNFIKLFFKPPRYRFQIFFLDFFGINILRIFIYKISYFFRGLFLRKKLDLILKKNRKDINKLEKDGIVISENFFSQSEFKKIEKLIRDMFAEIQHGKYRSSGAKIKTLSIGSDELCKKKKYIYDKFLKNDRVRDLVTYNMRPLIFHPNRVVLQEIYIPKNVKDLNDILHVFHADRYFNHLKFFYYVNDQSEKNGAYLFSKGSHKVSSFYRYLYEYESAFRASKNSFFKLIGLKSDRYNVSGYDSLKPFFKKKLQIKSSSINAKKNSLVISNNSGFHSRGRMEPNSKRIQVRLQFQYLEIGIIRSFILFILKMINPKIVNVLNDGR